MMATSKAMCELPVLCAESMVFVPAPCVMWQSLQTFMKSVAHKSFKPLQFLFFACVMHGRGLKLFAFEIFAAALEIIRSQIR